MSVAKQIAALINFYSVTEASSKLMPSHGGEFPQLRPQLNSHCTHCNMQYSQAKGIAGLALLYSRFWETQMCKCVLLK